MPPNAKTITFLAAIIMCASISCTEKTNTDRYFLSDHMDTTVSPGDNFFQYATGTWMKQNPIPEDESAWGIGHVVREDILHRIRKINQDAAAKTPVSGSTEQQIADFWTTGMDTVAIEQQGLAPLTADLEKISAIRSVEDILDVTADLQNKGINALFLGDVGQDDRNSSKMIYWLWQGGLLLPDRDYYFNTDSRTLDIQRTYLEYIAKTLQRVQPGGENFSLQARAVYNLEKSLASKSRKLEDLRDPERNYHKMHPAQLQDLAPNLRWPSYTKNIGIVQPDSVIVGQPEFYAHLNRELASTPAEVWKNYLRVQLVHAMAPYLDTATYKEYFQYRSKISGVSKQRPRWKRVLLAEEMAMGEAVGQLFVREYFDEATKIRYVALVKAILGAFKERMEKLTWMSDSTKQKALRKLAMMNYKVGYPDQWKDFSTMRIQRRSYAENVQSANTWLRKRNIDKLGKPVDKSEWKMTPQSYDAYYSPSNNEIVLPAAIFIVPGQPDAALDDAFVYGNAAAATIGHEVTHGFDDQGGQYDAMGNLSGWWAPADSVEFGKRAQKIISQFDAFNPIDTFYINGDATQGENIADLGGLILGLEAYKKTEEFKSGKKVGNLTPLQRYFLAYAFGWTFYYRKELAANLLVIDVHAPPAERVNGPVVNVPEFYEAFGVKKGDKMYREDSLRVNIW